MLFQHLDQIMSEMSFLGNSDGFQDCIRGIRVFQIACNNLWKSGAGLLQNLLDSNAEKEIPESIKQKRFLEYICIYKLHQFQPTAILICALWVF